MKDRDDPQLGGLVERVMKGRPVELSSRWLARLLAVFSLLSMAIAAPANAHKEHRQKQQATEQVPQQASPGARTSEAMQHPATAGHVQMGEAMEDMERDRSASFPERLLDWLGRLHPVIVHFPIAFFPAALFTAVVGRRREAFAKPVQFLVIAGGIIAPIAMILGWLDAMNADPDPLLTIHRWLGTTIGIAGLALGIWAWWRPGQDRSAGMMVALGVITAAIIVQGWYGGAMVHGIDHLNF